MPVDNGARELESIDGSPGAFDNAWTTLTIMAYSCATSTGILEAELVMNIELSCDPGDFTNRLLRNPLPHSLAIEQASSTAQSIMDGKSVTKSDEVSETWSQTIYRLLYNYAKPAADLGAAGVTYMAPEAAPVAYAGANLVGSITQPAPLPIDVD
jgi:hypothetical protein